MRRLCFLLLLFFDFCTQPILTFAQSGNWVWLKGESSSSSLGHYGTLGVSSPINEPPARYQCAYWLDLKGNFWIFGGVNNFNDLWKYNPTINEWTWVKGPQLGTNLSGIYGTQGVPSVLNNPPALGYGANCWTDTAGDLWLFAGFDLSGGFNNDVLWKYHIATNEWTWMKGSWGSTSNAIYGTKGIAADILTPGNRVECKSAWVSNNKLWLFGGRSMSTNGTKNDLWSYNIATNNWAWEAGTQLDNDSGSYGTKGVASASNVPPSRWSYTKWQDADNNFYLFGGLFSSSYIFNDVWKFEQSNKLWTWVSGTKEVSGLGTNSTFCTPSMNNIPSARYENQTTQTNNSCTRAFWTFGGFGYDNNSANPNKELNDLWLFNTANLEWTKVKGGDNAASFSYGAKGTIAASNLPPGRGGAAAWCDNTGCLYIFGGSGNIGAGRVLLNDLWKFIPDTSCFHTGLMGGVKLTPPSDTTVYSGDTIRMAIPKNCSVSVSPTSGSYMNTQTGIISFFAANQYTIMSASLDPNDPCIKSDTLSFKLKNYPAPVADFTITPAVAYLNNPNFNIVNRSAYALNYKWYCDGILMSSESDMIHAFPSVGQHCIALVATNKNGERDSVTKCCEVVEGGNVFVPNAFTPNGDGKNDVFQVIGGNVKFEKMNIYNHFGQLVFTTNDISVGWDGNYKGNYCEIGTYYYLIQYVDIDSKTNVLKGDVTLLR
jgi:gliding motility-associated-like protein